MKENIEWVLKRLIIPFTGLVGVMWEEMHSSPSPELLLMYAAMMGFSAPAVRTALQKPTGGG